LTKSEEEFKRHAQNSWFRFYNKEGARDSSLAFEHVFVGEIKWQTEVSGFHNGIQFLHRGSKGNSGNIWFTPFRGNMENQEVPTFPEIQA